eukprot:TRINITY_DN4583_c0_g2_i2.p1 TRINITY_DN4583_c0_g2~~TRINITY_DN4583_c0_g2_i2.p1  ORF type:complete len:152 (-),score=37.05 TRINITY_DN4583_c0_g2_i2:386-841(-)
MVIVLDLMFFSTALFYVEGSYCYFDANTTTWFYKDSGEPSPFQSITATFWWNIVTLSTVGYGDTYPITVGGRIVAGFSMVVSMVIVAFPIAVFTTNFSEQYDIHLAKKKVDPVEEKLIELKQRLEAQEELQRETKAVLERILLSTTKKIKK